MAERGVTLSHTSILLWCSSMSRSLKGAGIITHSKSATPGRVDETYIKVKGKWVYLYRAVDKAGRTGDPTLRALTPSHQQLVFSPLAQHRLRRLYRLTSRPPI
jgi:transposase-like protein